MKAGPVVGDAHEDETEESARGREAMEERARVAIEKKKNWVMLFISDVAMVLIVLMVGLMNLQFGKCSRTIFRVIGHLLIVQDLKFKF